MAFDIVQHSEKLSELLAGESPFATITLVDIRGSAPQIQGAKAIVTHSGIESGTIGGGKIEAAAIRHAQTNLLGDKGTRCEFVTWNLQTDIGMTCGGEVKLFFEYHQRYDWPIAVFGAGHVAQSLVPMLLNLHCYVTCIDTRGDWLSRISDHPKLTKRLTDSPQEVVAEFPDNTFFVLISKGHKSDLPVLAEILRTRTPPYIGVIGSDQKASVLRRELKQMEIPDEKIDSYHCPIGLPLGNNTPAEISISILAQLIQQRDELKIVNHKTKAF